VENFATEVTFPEQLEGEDLLLGEGEEGLLFDENGMPIEGDPALEDPGAMPGTDPEPLDDAFIERAIGRREPRSSRDEDDLREPQ
jgi:hypothetical protein